jgi:alcohol dehydrogenase (NADP+)
MKTYTAAKGSEIPALGLGTWKLQRHLAEEVVSSAIDIGYRHFDCAPVYNNQHEIGTALSAALSSGKVQRDEIWVTSKLWSNAHAPKHVRPALERTLLDLGLKYLDLYLIHWPVCIQPGIAFPKRPDQFISPTELPLSTTWKAMEKMVKNGLCRHIGVCNCNIKRLREIQLRANILPAVNQIELHPYLQQHDMLEYCTKHGITVTAYSPLGSGSQPEGTSSPPPLLHHPLIAEIAFEHDATPAQVLLAWGLQRNTIVIPKSTNPAHLQSNFSAQGIRLQESALKKIESLEMNYRFLDGRFWAPPGSPYSVTDFWQNKTM